MHKFTEMNFSGPITASSNAPEKDGYVGMRGTYPYHIHPTATPEVWAALQECINELEIIPYKEPVKPVQTYVEKRQGAYPSIEDQLDTLYHGGYDAWKATIKAVKDTHPKE